VEVSSLPFTRLLEEKEEEPSEKIRERVEKARLVQRERFRENGIFFNAHMNSSLIKKHCPLNAECQALLKQAVEQLNFSARAYDKIRKVARTIADLDGSADIQAQYLTEAIQYRSLDRGVP
jgi:magnesium chelatase family protein